MAININKKILIIPLILLVLLSAIYYYYYKQSEINNFIIKQYIPKEGDKILLSIPTVYENDTKVKNVKITFMDKITGDSFTNSSSNRGFTIIPVIIGKTYTITASYNNLVKIEDHTFQSNSLIKIVISNDDKIISYIYYQSIVM